MQLREQIRVHKVDKQSSDKDTIDTLTQQADEFDTQARDLRAKAESIEDAVYDLQAVNPNEKAEEDTKTPEQLLDLIAAKGREVEEVLSALRATLATRT